MERVDPNEQYSSPLNKRESIEPEKFKREDREIFEVFVGGIPFSLSEREVKDFFSTCGKVHAVKLLQTPDGKSKGRGFVKFLEKNDQLEALKLSGSELKGKILKVEETKNNDRMGDSKFQSNRNDNFKRVKPDNGDIPKSKSLICRNIDYNVTETQFSDFWKNYQGIVRSRLMMQETGKNRGFGFLEFESISDAEKALDSTNLRIGKFVVRLEFSNPNRDSRPQNSFKPKIRFD